MTSAKTQFTLVLFLGLASCGDPNEFVRKAPVKPAINAVAEIVKPAKVTAPATPTVSNDGLRLPDMLALPSDEQLRPSAVSSEKGSAPVTVRPPKE